MLKLTYAENSFNLELINEPWENWVNKRVVLALSAATQIYMKPSTAAFVIPAQLSDLADLEKLAPANMIELCPCDASWVEVILKGIWLTSDANSEVGVFVTSLSKAAELLLEKIAQSEQFCHV
ncbi:alr0857 family protein [Calothrix sp. PCC 7507]|uniref:alr0857 family protein n=1 Tax=Calothrix sp. PCC 7507 TaxID=99598 RepID=UPI00029F28F6|nr:alr0857 family protein [Calothrix sp. PCC 7507]AFY30528.1 hypothetical protein Cal7507_0014 [Calothrix sp. PCC 7507]